MGNGVEACVLFSGDDSGMAGAVARELARHGIPASTALFEIVALGDSVANRLQGWGQSYGLVMFVLSPSTPHHEWALGEMGRLNALASSSTLYVPVLAAGYQVPESSAALAVVAGRERSVYYGVSGLVRLLLHRDVGGGPEGETDGE